MVIYTELTHDFKKSHWAGVLEPVEESFFAKKHWTGFEKCEKIVWDSL